MPWFIFSLMLVCMLPLMSSKSVLPLPHRMSHSNGILYLNTLTVGTGMNRVDTTLVNETVTFVRAKGSAWVFWKIESEMDLGTEPVIFALEKREGGSFVPFDNLTIENHVGFGHYCMCGPYVMTKPGEYRATGISLMNGRPIASAEFAVE
jgi:hypothetical protein